MSFTDLNKDKNFIIDEFISDAEDYAKGTPKIVNELTNQVQASQKLNLKQAISDRRY